MTEKIVRNFRLQKKNVEFYHKSCMTSDFMIDKLPIRISIQFVLNDSFLGSSVEEDQDLRCQQLKYEIFLQEIINRIKVESYKNDYYSSYRHMKLSLFFYKFV